MSDNLQESSKQKETVTKDSISKLSSSEGINLDTGIPERYLNKNVQAMISGGRQKLKPTYLLHFDRVISFLKKKYRVEVRISENDT